jgi:uncharacterized protein (DUF1697 family)
VAGRTERAPGTYVALLRGINLGARNKVSMADLRELFHALGAEDVATYLQSGNVVFKSRAEAAELVGAIQDRIRSDLGLDVTVLVRTSGELGQVLARNPFAKSGREPTRLHVTFLAETPPPARVRKLDPKHSEPDEFEIVGREVYLHTPNGYGRSKLSNAYFEKQLGVAATTRNWRTVTNLAELASA